MQGWIKLHRKVMESDTFSKLNAIQQIITIYIILNANHEDGIWYDKYKDIEVKVKRGQLITSRKKIADEWFKGDKEVTEQKIRTTLKKLEKLNFITITPTNNYTLIEVLNYNVYQKKENEANQVVNQESTKSQPSNNQEKTTNKNDKNDKNDKEEKIIQQIKDLRSAYSDDLRKVIDEYWKAMKQTRKSNSIQYSVILKTMEKWTKYDKSVIEYSLKKHLTDYADGERDEKYTLGIMRGTNAYEAKDLLDKGMKRTVYKPTGSIPAREEFNLDDE